MNKTYEIPETNLDNFKAAIAFLNKKAKKLGCALITFIVLETVTKKLNKQHLDQFGRVVYSEFYRYEKYYKIQIEGEAPQLPGWKFCGIVDFRDEGISTYLLALNPGVELPENFKKHLDENFFACDHCNKKRRRNYTFIVQNTETGEYKLVGKSCLKDFTGHTSPGRLASYFQHIEILVKNLDDEEYEEFYGTSYVPLKVDLEDFILSVIICAKSDGYVSSSQCFDEMITTGKCAIDSLDSKGPAVLKRRFHENKDNEEYKRIQGEIINYIPTLWQGERYSDFVHNLRSCWETGLVTEKTCNIIASAYICYEREENRKAQKASQENSTHQGNVGDKVKLSLTCIFTRELESYYGMNLLCKFQDKDGNIYTWFNSGSTEIERGESYVLTGRIKSHKEYNGINETQLTRCRVK